MKATKPKAANWLLIDVARWYDCMLGKSTDRELARRVGTTENRIARRRQHFGIDPYSVSQAMAPYKHLLGVESDKSVASICEVSVPSVRAYRKSLGIPPMPKAKAIERPQTKPYVDPLSPFRDLLGKVPDADVARLSGIGIEEVASARQSLRLEPVILAPDSRKFDVVPDYHGPLLGYESMLGKFSDAKISRQVGVPISLVERRRTFLGIEPYQRVAQASRYSHLLGEVSDSLLAKLAGVSRTRISDMRKAMERNKRSATAPVTQAEEP